MKGNTMMAVYRASTFVAASGSGCIHSWCQHTCILYIYHVL